MKKKSCAGCVAAVVLIHSWIFGQSRIGFVDSQKILTGYEGAQDAMKEIDTENNNWGQELQKMNDHYNTMKEEIEQQSLLLSEAKRKEKAQELENLAKEIQQYRDKKWGEGGDYFRKREEALRPIFDKINQAVATVADDNKIDIIFDSVNGNILYALPKYDMTEDVLEELTSMDADSKKAQKP
ncbi:OmpH family outer membrane protein [bacterium]|nr:OmpH family outer membrane protein [bacterium]